MVSTVLLKIFFLLNLFELFYSVKYVVLNRPEILLFDKNHVEYINISSNRLNRRSMYYTNIHVRTVKSIDKDYKVWFYLYEWLTNIYKPSFVELHLDGCTVFTNKYTGPVFREGGLNVKCPVPPGEYHLENITVPINILPDNFPFTRGRLFANVTYSNKTILFGHIDFYLKEYVLEKNIRL